MKRYHGTNLAFAKHIIGPPCKIDLSKGGGELGKGFYIGSNVSLSSSWAIGRYKSQGVVIEFNIKHQNYYKLKRLVIKNRKDVYRIWKILSKNSKKKTYEFNYDIVKAPFATIEHSFQEKFESVNAKFLLEKSSSKII